MKIEIINTGSELLLGSTLNTHGAWLGQRLIEMGLRVQRLVTVPDGEPIREAIRESIAVSDVIIVTGGLGPTSDDITREATAEALGVELIEDEHAVRCIEAYFEKINRPMTPSNLKQAQHPCGADVLPNPNGTAPGVYVPSRLGTAGEKKGCAIFLLPGPPHEMNAMYEAEVAPRLRAMIDIPKDFGVSWVKFSGVGESRFQDELDARLVAIGGAEASLEIGYCARPGELDLRLLGAEALRLEAAQLAIDTYPESYVSNDESSLEKTVVDILTSKNLKLALIESCTGGRIASRITDISGSSEVFSHGYVTYSNEAKAQLLGVRQETLAEYGAVSQEVAMEMAKGGLLDSSADIAISVTGTAGPTGGSEEKPVGTVWIGISRIQDGEISTSAVKKYYPQSREIFKQQVSQAALMIIINSLRS